MADLNAVRGLFRSEDQKRLNEKRWKHFINMGLSVQGKSVFEAGAGIGDQTEWLLKQGAAKIYVNEGREDNRLALLDTFGKDGRVKVIGGNLESCLSTPAYKFTVDFIYFYGIYSHIANPDKVLAKLATMGTTIALDYLTGTNQLVKENPADKTQSLSGVGCRCTREGAIQLLKPCWKYVYVPRVDLGFDRRVVVASHEPIENGMLALEV